MKIMTPAWIVAALLPLAGSAAGQTFGKVVPVGGMSADLAVDEARRVLYVANFTANRIDVVNLETATLDRSMNVSGQPSSLALSADGQYLLVGHYANFTTSGTPKNALTLIDLNAYTRQTISLTDAPFGVAFTKDGTALVVTSSQFLLFDPVLGTTRVLDTIAGVAKTLPQPQGQTPAQIVAASVAVSGDGVKVHGLTDSFFFSYDALTRKISATVYTAAPPLGPRAVSVSKDGGLATLGWAVFDRRGQVAQFPNPTGELNKGSTIIDSTRGTIYAQIPEAGTPATARPLLGVYDIDNLTLREQLYLAENLTGKGVLSADGQMAYALSESGVTLLPVGAVQQAARLAVMQRDLVFRGGGCDSKGVSQWLTVYNPGGGAVDFTLSVDQPGIRLSQTSGTTPASIMISVDPAAVQNLRGTLTATVTIRSSQAVNVPPSVRLLVNLQDPDQRGTFIPVSGKLADLLTDPIRNRFYVINQDANQVLVYDGSNSNQIAALRTGSKPFSMTITQDRRYLLVGNDNSQIANVYDLETLQATEPVRFPFGHYPRSIAASSNAILAATRVAGTKNTIDRVDLTQRVATELSSLGVFENGVSAVTAAIPSPNGNAILFAQGDGKLLLYSAVADTFTVSRSNVAGVNGAVAASSFDQYVVGNVLYNASLVPVKTFDTAVGTPSGFVFVGQAGFRTGATGPTVPGVIQRVSLPEGSTAKATRMVEAPLLPGTPGFMRTLGMLADRNTMVSLTTSGITVLSSSYDTATAVPRIEKVVNSADGTQPVAPGGLISVFGRDLSPINVATREIPLPTALGESCLLVNGMAIPMLLASSGQINAQLPFNAEGNVTLTLRTPGGVSDNYNLTILPNAPSLFLANLDQDLQVPTIVRAANGLLVTPANPVHRGDTLTIYLTGMGKTYPDAVAGMPAPGEPALQVLTQPEVDLAGAGCPVDFAGLAPGEIGVNQINVRIPYWAPQGMSLPLRVTQGGFSTTVQVRVVD